MANFKPAKMDRLKPQPLSALMEVFVRMNSLGPGLYENAVLDAWDKCSGVPSSTVNKYLRNGVLHVTFSSSVVRSSVALRLNGIMDAMLLYLKEDYSAGISGISDGLKEIRLH